MRILIVDDDPLSLLILKRHLLKLGHEVVESVSGDAAWRALENDAFPVIVSDWMMPGEIDGLELFRRIRRKSGPRIYLILVTAKTETEERDEALAAGADGFLLKPFKREDLSDRLRVAESKSETDPFTDNCPSDPLPIPLT